MPSNPCSGQGRTVHARAIVEEVLAWRGRVEVAANRDTKRTDVPAVGWVRLLEADVILASLRLSVVGPELEADAVRGVPARQATLLLRRSGNLAQLDRVTRVDPTPVLLEVRGVAQRRKGARGRHGDGPDRRRPRRGRRQREA